MTNSSRSDETKFEPDPKDGRTLEETLTDEQLAAIAAGRLASPAGSAMASRPAPELERAKMMRDREPLL